MGSVPEVPRFLLANGFSGHGMQHAPAVSRAISKLIVDRKSRSLDISALSVERLADRAGVPERNIL